MKSDKSMTVDELRAELEAIRKERDELGSTVGRWRKLFVDLYASISGDGSVTDESADAIHNGICAKIIELQDAKDSLQRTAAELDDARNRLAGSVWEAATGESPDGSVSESMLLDKVRLLRSIDVCSQSVSNSALKYARASDRWRGNANGAACIIEHAIPGLDTVGEDGFRDARVAASAAVEEINRIRATVAEYIAAEQSLRDAGRGTLARREAPYNKAYLALRIAGQMWCERWGHADAAPPKCEGGVRSDDLTDEIDRAHRASTALLAIVEGRR